VRKSSKKDAHEFEHGFAVSRETFVTVIANLVDIYERERRLMAPFERIPVAPLQDRSR